MIYTNFENFDLHEFYAALNIVQLCAIEGCFFLNICEAFATMHKILNDVLTKTKDRMKIYEETTRTRGQIETQACVKQRTLLTRVLCRTRLATLI